MAACYDISVRVAIRLVVKFMLWYAAAIFSIGIVLLAREYGPGLTVDRAIPLVHAAVRSFSYASLPAVVFAACVSLFAVVRLAVAPAASLALLALCWTALIAVSGLLVSLPVIDDSPLRATLPVGRIARAGSAAVYVVEPDAGNSRSVVVRDGAHGFAVYDAAPGDGWPAQLPAALLADAATGLGPVGSLALSVTRAVDDVSAVYRAIRLDTVSIPGLLQIGALSIFMLGCWTLARLTRWPLFNAILVVVALRAAVWFVASSRTGTIRDLVILGFSSQVVPYLGSAVLGFTGLAVLSIAVLLPPLDTWKRELVDG